ncbi:MAG: acyltransferase family protein [Cyanobacteria bacterium]|nr:acyltransferase family protein [Cyanobacteriota bacterium]
MAIEGASSGPQPQELGPATKASQQLQPSRGCDNAAQIEPEPMQVDALTGASNTKTPIPKSPYRPEIDGLRAFAVIAVIINHFNKDLLPSGYLGVDIFFVISGYVITSSLANHRSESFGDFFFCFYARRVKRLVPALVVFVLITSVLICLFNPDPGVSLGVGRRALLGISNINLYRASTDYFATSTELNPFTHTWSLGVEEQFYLLFPLLIWFSGFGRVASHGARNLLWVTLTLSIASLIAFIYLYPVNQPAAYFLMPPRIWELGTGCVLFLGLNQKKSPNGWLGRIAPLLITIALIATLLLPQDQGLPATVLVATLTAGLIAYLRRGSMLFSWFTQKPIAFVGAISYSLYLWHWSVLCISRWTIGIHWWSAPFQAILIFILAIGSFRFIEAPLRRVSWGATKSREVLCATGATFVIFIGLSLSQRLTEGALYLGDKDKAIRATQREVVEGTAIAPGKCSWFKGNGPSLPSALRDCTLTPPGMTFDYENTAIKRFFILGDSHASNFTAWISAMNKIKKYRIRILYVNSQISPPMPRALDGRGLLDLRQQERVTSTTAKSLRKGDVVILSNYLLGYLSPKRSCRFTSTSCIKLWTEKLQALVDQAKRSGAVAIVISPLPDFPPKQASTNMPWNITKETCTKQLFRPFIDHDCFQQRARIGLATDIAPILLVLKAMEARNNNFYVYNPFPLMCPDSASMCSNYYNGEMIFFDNHHLNLNGARIMSEGFNQFLIEKKLITGTSKKPGFSGIRK